MSVCHCGNLHEYILPTQYCKGWEVCRYWAQEVQRNLLSHRIHQHSKSHTVFWKKSSKPHTLWNVIQREVSSWAEYMHRSHYYHQWKHNSTSWYHVHVEERVVLFLRSFDSMWLYVYVRHFALGLRTFGWLQDQSDLYTSVNLHWQCYCAFSDADSARLMLSDMGGQA